MMIEEIQSDATKNPNKSKKNIFQPLEASDKKVLSEERKKAMYVFTTKNFQFSSVVYNFYIQKVIEKYEFSIGSNLRSDVIFFLYDAHCIFRMEPGGNKSSRDTFEERDMKHSSRQVLEELAQGAHGHLFCSKMYFRPVVLFFPQYVLLINVTVE